MVIQSKWPCANEVSEISPVRYVGDHFPFHIEGWWLFFYPPSYLTLTIELGKRGDFIECIRGLLENIGIEEVGQSALCKLSEQIADRLGVSVSNSKQLLEEGVFSSTMRERQFNKLFMSIFCDILVQNRIIVVNM